MLNRIALIGRMVREPEYRATGNGTSVCSFTLAVDRDFKNQAGEKEVDFIDCVAWRQAAEFATKYLRKGMLAAVAGRLQIRSWTGKDGQKRRSCEVQCDNVYACEPRRDTEKGKPQSTPEYSAQAAAQTQGGFPETMEMLGRFGAPMDTRNDFAVLEDDDTNFPF